jgi:hypothetical protein
MHEPKLRLPAALFLLPPLTKDCTVLHDGTLSPSREKVCKATYEFCLLAPTDPPLKEARRQGQEVASANIAKRDCATVTCLTAQDDV